MPSIFAGLDVGMISDPSALVIGDVYDKRIKILEVVEFPLGRYPNDEIRHYYTIYKWRKMAIDYTTEKSFADQLELSGIPLEKVNFTNPTKNDMISNLWNLVKDRRITIPTQYTELKSQMLEQQRIQLTSNVRYEHPQGRHDDQFWALCLCCYVAKLNLMVEPAAVFEYEEEEQPESSIRVVRQE